MSTSIVTSLQALQNSQKAFQQGDISGTRRWARLAATLDPRCEEAWLLMAAVASPQASIGYLKHALAVNPGSQRARQGLAWANKRLSANQMAETRPHKFARPAAKVVPAETPPASPLAELPAAQISALLAPAAPSPAVKTAPAASQKPAAVPVPRTTSPIFGKFNYSYVLVFIAFLCFALGLVLVWNISPAQAFFAAAPTANSPAWANVHIDKAGATVEPLMAEAASETPAAQDPAEAASPTTALQEPATALPTDAPQDFPTAVPQDFPTAIPQDFPTAVAPVFPTAVPQDVLTAVPQDFPTASPTPLPQDTPAPESTEIASAASPTPLPTDTAMPAPAKTQAPPSQPGDNPPAPSYGGAKKIVVSISKQHMYVYEGDSLVYSFVISTGLHNSTATGTFSVLDKIPKAYGSTWDLWMPAWMGIYYAGSLENGIHALPILSNGSILWAGLLGQPASFGCVILSTSDAWTLYNWATVGTPVIIQR